MCNGICERLKTDSTQNGLRYKTGQKRCSLCAHFFHTENISCPCCKTRLRSKPKNRSRNKKLNQVKILLSRY